MQKDHELYRAELTKERASDPFLTITGHRWILRPSSMEDVTDLSLCDGKTVFYGGSYTDEEWEKILLSHGGCGYVLQEFRVIQESGAK